MIMIKYILLSTLLVNIHSWYPFECCSDKDCAPVDCSTITYDKGQFYYNGSPSPRAEVSPDKKCHVCTYSDGKPKCLFIVYKDNEV